MVAVNLAFIVVIASLEYVRGPLNLRNFKTFSNVNTRQGMKFSFFPLLFSFSYFLSRSVRGAKVAETAVKDVVTTFCSTSL